MRTSDDERPSWMRTVGGLGGVILVLGCGVPDPTPQMAPAQEAAREEVARSHALGSGTGDEQREAASFCAHLSRDEIEAAFGNAVTFGASPSRQDEILCVYSIEDGSGMRQFAFGQRRIEDLENIKRNYRDSSTPFEQIDGLGREAFLVNEAQLEIRIDEASAVTLAATILVFGAEPPVGKERVRTGLVELGQKLIDRL